MKFNEVLKYLRKREGLSQAELAKKLDIAPSTIGMYEQGRREPDFETEEKIADFFNVSIDILRGLPQTKSYQSDKYMDEIWKIFNKIDDSTKARILAYAQAFYDMTKNKGGEENE